MSITLLLEMNGQENIWRDYLHRLPKLNIYKLYKDNYPANKL